jgi:AcrR family transcriptional regulator
MTAPANQKPSTREAILDAAADLFSRQEYHAVSMEDLAREASVAKGTLYYYFGSKEGVFLTLTGDRSERMLEMLERAVSESDSAEYQVRSLTVHTFMFFVKYPSFFWLWEKALAQDPCERTAPFETMRERLRGLIQMVICGGMADGILRPVSPDTAADVLFGAVLGAVPRCLDRGVDDPITLRQREQLFDFVWEALRARPDGHSDSPGVTAPSHTAGGGAS